MPIPESKPLHVLLVDDHALFREGVAGLLQRLGTTLRLTEAGDAATALDCIRGIEPPDLALVDLILPGLPGIDLIALLREAAPSMFIVVMSSSDEPSTVMQAIERGAVGFIPKSSSSAVMIDALRQVLAQRVYLPPSLVHAHDAGLAAGRRSAPTAAQTLNLTPRQADVLDQILLGKPIKQICRDLGLSEGTVKTHTSAVLRALNVTTRTQAVVAMSKLGLRIRR
ncbi:MAG: response regulator transcription factor [Rubrivivax sp.]